MKSITCLATKLKSIDTYHNNPLPIAAGGTGVKTKADLLKLIGVTENLGKYYSAHSVGKKTLSGTMNTFTELTTLTLPAGTYNLVGVITFSGFSGIPASAICGIRLFNKTNNSSMGQRRHLCGANNTFHIEMTMNAIFSKTTTIAVQATGNAKFVFNDDSGYLQALCVK